VHRTFDEKITDMHNQHENKQENYDKKQICSLLCKIQNPSINCNHNKVEKIKTVSLFSIRNVHVGVVSFFYIPANP
jgi:hypothetical protein